MKAKFLTRRQRRRLNKHIKKEADRLLTTLESRRKAYKVSASPEITDAISDTLDKSAKALNASLARLLPICVEMAKITLDQSASVINETIEKLTPSTKTIIDALVIPTDGTTESESEC